LWISDSVDLPFELTRSVGLLGEDKVGLAAASPAGYQERGASSPDQGQPSWAHPVVSGGLLDIRNQGTLAAYDIRAQ
jgi:hypothetical protein